MFGPQQATAQAEALETASAASPLRQIRYELHARAQEWKRCAKALDEEPDDRVGIVVGAVAPAMQVLMTDGWAEVVRVLHRDAQVSLHVLDESGRERYENHRSVSSPVVVRK
jgi:hypothetical protein